MRIILRFAATGIAIGTAVQEGLTLFNFLHTRNHIKDGRGPWALKTELWTSILLFVASVLTVILGVIMIAAYLISIRAANKVSTVQTYFAVAIELGHIALWIGVAIGYRVSNFNPYFPSCMFSSPAVVEHVWDLATCIYERIADE